MELKSTIRRWRYVYGWRLRHWWLDTPSGRHAQWMAAIIALLGLVAWTVVFTWHWMQPAPAGAPHEAYIVALIALIVAIVAAVVAYANAPKPKDAAPAKKDAPQTDDGQSAVFAFGTVWVPDSFLLAWKIVGREPIKSSGGKK